MYIASVNVDCVLNQCDLNELVAVVLKDESVGAHTSGLWPDADTGIDLIIGPACELGTGCSAEPEEVPKSRHSSQSTSHQMSKFSCINYGRAIHRSMSTKSGKQVSKPMLNKADHTAELQELISDKQAGHDQALKTEMAMSRVLLALDRTVKASLVQDQSLLCSWLAEQNPNPWELSSTTKL